jgi:hypothetical protein
MPDLADEAVKDRRSRLNGAFRAMTTAHTTIASVQKVEVLHDHRGKVLNWAHPDVAKIATIPSYRGKWPF